MLQSLTSKVIWVGVATVAVSIMTSPESAQAAGLRFNSQISSTEYQYQVFASFDGELSAPGKSFTLTGLSGVTGASVSGIFGSLLDSSFTDSSVTFTWNNSPIGSFDANDVNGTPFSQFDFRIFSTSSTIGSVLSQGPNGFFEVTQGPVAAIPEPATSLPGLIGVSIPALCKRKGRIAAPSA